MPTGSNDRQDTLLGPYRVLDLCDEKGLFCGRILGDLGADVIKVEPPGGDPARQVGPFYKDEIHPEKSLFWFAYCLNKRSVTLDITNFADRECFLRLVATTDFVLESFPPGYLAGLGLSYEKLREVNPRLILVSITPFGQTGPYAQFQAPDMVVWAMGGIMYVSGEPDRPPVQVSCPQAYLQASAQAAVGALVAHYHRERTGEGQWVDTSAQQAAAWVTMDLPGFWDLLRVDHQRSGTRRVRLTPKGLVGMRVVLPCKDGFVHTYLPGGLLGGKANQALTEWMEEEGADTSGFANTGWPAYDSAQLEPEQASAIDRTAGDFFATHTKAALYRGALEREIMLVPVSSARDVLENEQLADREFWIELEHPELGTQLIYPGPWARLTVSPMKGWRRAPLIGEHNREILEQELGYMGRGSQP